MGPFLWRWSRSEGAQWLCVAGLATSVLLLALGPAPLDSDTSRAMLMARDLEEGVDLYLRGPPSSFGRFVHGTPWIDFLGVARAVTLSIDATSQLVVVLAGASVAIVWTSVRRHLGARAGALCAVAWLFSVPLVSELPRLVTTSLLPVALALAHWSLLNLAAYRRARDAAASGVLLAFCMQMHGASAVLLGPWIFFLPLARRPLTAVLVGCGGLGASLGVGSPLATLYNVAALGRLAPVVAGVLGLIALVGLAQRSRWSARPAPVLLRSYLVAAATLTVLPAVGVTIAHRFEWRYVAGAALPFIVAAAALIDAGLRKAHALAERKPRFRPLTTLAYVGLFLLISVSGKLARERTVTRDSDWSMSDMQRITEVLEREGYGYHQIRSRLVGPQRGQLIGGFAAFQTGERARRSWTQDDTLLLFRIPMDHPLHDHPRVLRTGSRGALVRQPNDWLDQENLVLCINPRDARESCREGGVGVDPARVGRSHLSRAYPHVLHGKPLADALAHADAEVRVTYRLRVAPRGDAPRRRVAVLATRDADCPWRIGAWVSEGDRMRPVSSPSGEARLERHFTEVRVSRSFGSPGCPSFPGEALFVPGLVEWDPDDTLIPQLVRITDGSGTTEL